MKIRIVPVLAALLLGAPLAAQIAGPPSLIDYQGRLLNSVGGPLTSADTNPGIAKNYEIRFRVWDAQSGGTLIWAEKQIVTVTADGLFSVRLGEGEEITVADGDPLALTGSVPNGPGALLLAFDGKERFLGVTVMNPPSAPGEIQPRLAFLASPFAINAEQARLALSASQADTVINSSINSDSITDGSVTLADLANGSVDGNTIVDGSVGASDLADNSVTGTSIVNGTITSADLANGSVTKAKLGSDVGVWGVAGNSPYKTTYFNTSGSDRVGIGTTSASAPLHVNNSFYQYTDFSAMLRNDGVLTPGGYWQTISIISSGVVKAEAFTVASDVRFKKVIGRSNGIKDLETLGQIEVTDYQAIDQLTKGSGQHKKVIAQQVEAVFPQAVSTSTDVIPDVFKEARSEDGWVVLTTDLKRGERVRLLAEGIDGVFEVLEVKGNRFRVDWDAVDGDVFVYGREVDDFRAVDYDAISMLNVSATQELHRRLTAVEGENEALKRRIADLEARDAARDERLSAIETLLKSSQDEPLRTVSVEGR